MKPKKYEPVNYIAVKQRKHLWISAIIALILLIAIHLAVTIKCFVVAIQLTLENQELNELIQTKNSMISDLEENCKDLFIENQNLKFGGNK